LGDRHLPVLEVSVVQAFLEPANEKSPGQRFLLGESGSVDGLESPQELLRLGEVFHNRLFRDVGDLVVPALVSKDRRELGASRERVLPVLGEKIRKGLAPCFHLGSRLGGRETGRDQQETGSENAEHISS